ncbi:MAG TPA: hypothetical protein DEB74_05975 [Lachnospiraceae bacterium]|nr:hypothetical protein [Lachnospiraceae bacterium]
MKTAGKFGVLERLNAKSAQGLIRALNEPLNIVGIGIDEERVDEETGEIKPCTYFVCDDGKLFTAISPTVREVAEDMIETFNGEVSSIGIVAMSRTNKSGDRDYIVINVTDIK